ncbi:AraC family transcriptional regulator [Paenibacillus dokdonensis]|uniref:AraC family transcriptional regulator n=1 Tax=Paenibacillus dokdonensis TaxID=2567944 RepID=UPI0010A8F6D4|nr:AraC family transcriptional regulator [Paenibacillus dokdonensis]
MPDGQQLQIREVMLPDVEATFRIYAAHWRTVAQGWEYPLHAHPLFEINLLMEGRQTMEVSGRTYVQEPGDLLLLKPEDLHESRSSGDGNMTYYCIHFDTDERALRELLCRDGQRYFSGDSPLACAIRPSLDKLIDLTSEDAAGKLETKMRTLSAMFELFAALTGSLSERENSRLTHTRAARIAERIAADLERAVEDTANEDGTSVDRTADTVAAVTAGLGYSMSACTRMFQRVYGISPRGYLSQLKLKKAKLLLMQPELSVESVSRMLGYGDIAHFSRQFKRWTGEAPGKFRGKYHI